MTTETSVFEVKTLGQRDVQSLTSAIDRLRNMLTATGIAATAVWAGNRFLGSIEDATQAAIVFESKLSSVRKTTGLSGQSLDVLKNRLTDLATTFGGFKIDELFDVAAMGGRLGIAGNKIADFARDIGMIRVALEDIPAEAAATGIARILNVFRLGSEQTINFASALNKLDDSSTATGRDILDITQRIAGSAQALGLAPQKVLALATALKDAGVSNEVAGTAISQIFGRMSVDVERFADVAGVNVMRFARTLRADPLAALSLFEKGLKKFDGETQLQILDHLNLDGMRVKGTLLQLATVMDKIPGYVRTANKEWQSLDSILKENAIAGNTTEAQLDRMRAAYQKIAMQVGEATLPIVKAFAGSMVELSTNLGTFLKANEGTLTSLSEWFTTAARSAGLLVNNFGLFANLVKEFALDKLVSAITIFSRVGDQLSGNLQVGFANAVTFISNALSGLGTLVASLFAQMGNTSAVSFVKSFAAAIPDGMKKAINLVSPALGLALDSVAKMKPTDLPVDASGLTNQALNRGVQPLPGFANPLANLPQNEHGEAIVAILGEIRAARAKADADANEAKKAQLPVGNPAAVNPFAKMTPAQRGAAQTRMRQQRSLLASQQRLANARKPKTAKNRARLPGAVAGAAGAGPNAKVSPLKAQQDELARQQALLTQAQDEAVKKNAVAGARRAANPRLLDVDQERRRNAAQQLIDRQGANQGARQAGVQQQIAAQAARDQARQAAQQQALEQAKAQDDARRAAAQQRQQQVGRPAGAGAPQANLGIERPMVDTMKGLAANAAREATAIQKLRIDLAMVQNELKQTALRLTENRPTNLTMGHA